MKQGFVFAGSIWFPPLLLIMIPTFYFQSLKRLKPILLHLLKDGKMGEAIGKNGFSAIENEIKAQVSVLK